MPAEAHGLARANLREAVEAGDTTVHGLWNDIADGALHQYDPASGAIGEAEVFVVMQSDWGRPDGAAVDMEGCYWNAGVGAGRPVMAQATCLACSRALGTLSGPNIRS